MMFCEEMSPLFCFGSFDFDWYFQLCDYIVIFV